MDSRLPGDPPRRAVTFKSIDGVYHDLVAVPLNKIAQWNLLITGPKAEGSWAMEWAIPLLADGRLNLKPLMTHKFSSIPILR